MIRAPRRCRLLASLAALSCIAIVGCSDAPEARETTSVAPTTRPAPPTVAPATVAPTTVAPTTVAPTTVAPTTVAPTTVAPTTTLALEPVWADEFDGAAGAAPDPARWSFDIGGTGWGNGQLEYYSDANARTDGQGHLLITSHPLDVTSAPACWYGACHFMSSRLTTAGTASWQYGRFEVRASFPSGQATWPAFWLLGADVGDVGWPESGEIDVVEHVGRDGSVVRGTAHGPGYSGGEGRSGSTDVGDPTGFHVYAVEWGPSSIVWSVDGVEYHRLDKRDVQQWAFDHDFFLVLDLAVGGLLGGEPSPVDFQVKTFAIDYVRVYAP